MNPKQNKLTQKTGEETVSHQQSETSAAHDFETPEEMIRFDAGRHQPPDAVARRLAESLAGEKPLPWWKRIFRRN
jgi:hypothetical protein